jgi:hypothetical protein
MLDNYVFFVLPTFDEVADGLSSGVWRKSCHKFSCFPVSLTHLQYFCSRLLCIEWQAQGSERITFISSNMLTHGGLHWDH